VPRFYDVQDGAVLVGGHDVRSVPLDWLRAQVAMVLQDVFLFHGSVQDNLLFGRPDATGAELRAAARAAHAEEFIRDLPDGYDTIVGERGVRLSGGQKQRLSIARALLKDAPILILDEPTSSVDVETEALIQDALARLSAGRTTIVIAHRLSTIRSADRIAVLHEGRVAESGNHETLLARSGRYAHLYLVQIAGQTGMFPARAT
jgi:ABC-type multidrug transport system fused ATPase/permease subunit